MSNKEFPTSTAVDPINTTRREKKRVYTGVTHHPRTQWQGKEGRESTASRGEDHEEGYYNLTHYYGMSSRHDDGGGDRPLPYREDSPTRGDRRPVGILPPDSDRTDTQGKIRTGRTLPSPQSKRPPSPLSDLWMQSARDAQRTRPTLKQEEPGPPPRSEQEEWEREKINIQKQRGEQEEERRLLREGFKGRCGFSDHHPTFPLTQATEPVVFESRGGAVKPNDLYISEADRFKPISRVPLEHSSTTVWGERQGKGRARGAPPPQE